MPRSCARECLVSWIGARARLSGCAGGRLRCTSGNAIFGRSRGVWTRVMKTRAARANFSCTARAHAGVPACEISSSCKTDRDSSPCPLPVAASLIALLAFSAKSLARILRHRPPPSTADRDSFFLYDRPPADSLIALLSFSVKSLARLLSLSPRSSSSLLLLGQIQCESFTTNLRPRRLSATPSTTSDRPTIPSSSTTDHLPTPSSFRSL
jgi:hypothetical protein